MKPRLRELGWDISRSNLMFATIGLASLEAAVVGFWEWRTHPSTIAIGASCGASLLVLPVFIQIWRYHSIRRIARRAAILDDNERAREFLRRVDASPPIRILAGIAAVAMLLMTFSLPSFPNILPVEFWWAGQVLSIAFFGYASITGKSMIGGGRRLRW